MPIIVDSNLLMISSTVFLRGNQMSSAMNHAKEQMRNLKVSIAIALALVVGIFTLNYLSDRGVIESGVDALILGLFTVLLLFIFSAIMFYAKAKTIERIVNKPIVHWKYSDDDDWMVSDFEEAIISDEGIYYSPAKNRVHPFWSFSSKLQSLKLGTLPDFEDYETMNFYFIRGKTMEGNTISAALYVPIPKGDESIARELVERINEQMQENRIRQIKFFAKSFSVFILILAITVVIYRNFFM